MKAWANETLLSNYGAKISPSQLDLLWSFIVSIFLIGGAIGSFIGSYVADRIGRYSFKVLFIFIFKFYDLLGKLLTSRASFYS